MGMIPTLLDGSEGSKKRLFSSPLVNELMLKGINDPLPDIQSLADELDWSFEGIKLLLSADELIPLNDVFRTK
jgi:hypothetical protein